ncbi:MAG: hypothetical protein ACK5P7_01470 [Bdellovibrio sp.]|jgi:hypothetical protein
MKTILIRWAFLIPSVLLVGAFFFSVQAHSQTLSANLVAVELDPSLGLPGDLRSGQIIIQKETQQLIIRLSRGNQCPSNAICRDLALDDVEIKLPMIEMSQTACGSKIYKASIMDIDGATQELTVFDNSRMKCMMLRAQTEVVLKTSSLSPISQTKSYLNAETLK